MSITGIGGLILFVAVCAAERDPATNDKPDPKAIVQQAADAMSRLKLVSFDFDYKTSGTFEAFFPNLSGPVIIGKESPDGAKRFFCKLKIQQAGSSEVAEVTAGADGTTYYRIDDKTKTVYADIDPQVLGKHRDAIDFTIPREFGMAKPFDEALNAGEMKYVKDEEVDGHQCHVIHLKSSMTAPAMDWYFSKQDHLPRRTRFSMNDPQGGQGAAEGTMKNLKIDPKIDRMSGDKSPFALVVPPGFKKTEEFAP